MVDRHVHIPSDEQDEIEMIRNAIKLLERELDGEDDIKKTIVLRLEVGKLKEKLGEMK